MQVQPRNGSGGGNQRQQQELIDETRRAARELERLSRERRDPQMQELSRQLNQTADEMQKAQASSRGNSNSNESIAQNERASIACAKRRAVCSKRRVSPAVNPDPQDVNSK